VTGPDDPTTPGTDEGDADWGFPQVDGPASVDLPVEQPPQVYDTGSDAWWRAQADAQRRAADSEPPVPPAPAAPVAPAAPPELVEPQVLVPLTSATTDPVPVPVPVPQPTEPEAAGAGPSPLDHDWLPAELAETPAAEGPAAEVPVVAPPVQAAAAVPPRAVPPVVPAVPVAEEPHVDEPVDAVPTGSARPRMTPPPAAPAEALAADEAATRPAYEGERVRPARALAGAALAVVGVALGIGALLLFQDDPKGSPTVQAPPSTVVATTQPTQAPTKAPTKPPTKAPTTAPTAAPTNVPPVVAAPAAPVVPVSVLNNSRTKGLAATAAARFRAAGWPVPTTGNYSGGIISTTTVYYAPGGQASAERFAKQFGIGRVAPRFPGLPTSGMTVVLTRDYR
jgi:hypothetical protein